MGESRYFPAYGARPQRGAEPDAWAQRDMAPGYAHAQDGWPREPSLTSRGYAPRAPMDHYGSAAPGHFAPPQPVYGNQPDPYAPDPYASDAYPSELYAPDPYAPRHAGQPQFYGHTPVADDFAAPQGAMAQARPQASPAARPVSVAGMAQGFGAVMSLVLMISGGVWAWQMMQRDVSGVPVVRALEGPLRVTPDDPGGAQAAHQGLSVTELAADGPSTLPNEFVLAPAPLDLDRDLNTPARDMTQSANEQERLIDVGFPIEGSPAPEAAAPLGIVRPNRLAVEQSPRPARRGAQAAAQRASTPAPATGAESDLAASIANSVAADLSRSGGVDVDPASIGPGTRLVQLGTYQSAAEARSAWDGLAQRFDPLLDDRGRVIEAAHSGGSVFYRLRAHGFNDERDARRFCAALIDQKMDCIPVLIR